MTVTRDLNLGTIIAVGIPLLAQTIAAVWWAATISADVNDIRSWQQRQDDRLTKVELTQNEDTKQNARIATMIEVLREEVRRNGETLLEEIRNSREQGDAPAR